MGGLSPNPSRSLQFNMKLAVFASVHGVTDARTTGKAPQVSHGAYMIGESA
jgi:hypothetical protein